MRPHTDPRTADKKSTASRILVLAGSLAIGCSCAKVVSLVTANRVDWDFIQAVGGMTVEDLRPVSEEYYYLPVRVDVSGLSAITCQPELVNSGLAVKDIKWKTLEHTIQIYVVTCAINDDHPSPVADYVLLGYLPRGEYEVRYVNADGTSVGLKRVVANYPPAG